MSTKPPTPAETWDYAYKLSYPYAQVHHPDGPQSEIESTATALAKLIIKSCNPTSSREECHSNLLKFAQEGLSDEEKEKTNFILQLTDKKLALNSDLVDPEDECKDLTAIQRKKKTIEEATAETEIILSRKCKVCGLKNTLPEPALKTCDKCKNAWYCSKEHQKQDWPRHKLTDCTLKKAAS